MLTEAPPAIVIAALVALESIPVSIALWVFDIHVYAAKDLLDLSSHASTAGYIYLALGLWRLAKRATGIAITIAWMVPLVLWAVGIALATVLTLYRFDAPHPELFTTISWVATLGRLVAMLALAIASRHEVGWLLAVAATIANPTPPAYAFMQEHLGTAGMGSMFLGVRIAQAAAIILCASAIAHRAEPATWDHGVAARRLTRSAWWLGGIAACSSGYAIVNTLFGESAIVLGVRVVLLVILACAIVPVALAQFPQLARYALHVLAFGVVLAIATTMDALLKSLDRHPVWELPDSRWMFDAPLVIGLLGLAWAARHYQLRWKLATALMTLLAISFAVVHANATLFSICTAVMVVIAMPLVRAMGEKLASDPVKTTADVFA
ncbi:MAG TPA: hypothetical protein VGC41_27940 [Kofleriaceae bacterium]